MYTGKLAETPLNQEKYLQPGPSPAFSAGASCRWCSAVQGLPGCHGEARGREGIEEHLPWSTFERLVHGKKGRDCGVLGVFIGQEAPG